MASALDRSRRCIVQAILPLLLQATNRTTRKVKGKSYISFTGSLAPRQMQALFTLVFICQIRYIFKLLDFHLLFTIRGFCIVVHVNLPVLIYSVLLLQEVVLFFHIKDNGIFFRKYQVRKDI